MTYDDFKYWLTNLTVIQLQDQIKIISNTLSYNLDDIKKLKNYNRQLTLIIRELEARK